MAPTKWITRAMADDMNNRLLIMETTLKESVIYMCFMIAASIYVRTAADFWFYLENVFVDSIYSESKGAKNETNVHKIILENLLIGVPRLRQIKVRNNTCTVNEYLVGYFLSCFSLYNKENEDKASFGLKKGKAWTFNEPTNKNFYWGRFSTYHSGGFYEDFPLDKITAVDMITVLKDNFWIQPGTRCVFVEFSVYNANVNVFSVLKIVFEFPPTGGVLPSMSFNTLKLLPYFSNWDYQVLAIEAIFIIFLLFYTLEELREFSYFGKRYFCKFWNLVDILILGLSYSYLIMQLINLQDSVILKKFVEEKQLYADLDGIVYTKVAHDILAGVLLFVIYLKLFKYLSVTETMGQINITLRKSSREVMAFSVMFLVIYFAFSELGYLLFGTQVLGFSSFGFSMLTLFRTILGDFDYREIQRTNRLLAAIYFLFFLFLVFFVSLNMFLAIITDTYEGVKTEASVAPDEIQLTEYSRRVLVKKFKLKCLMTRRERGITVDEIRETLKNCGYPQIEINEFLKHCNINSSQKYYNIDIFRESIPQASLFEEELGDATHTSSDLQTDEFFEQQERMNRLNEQIEQLIHKIELLREMDD